MDAVEVWYMFAKLSSVKWQSNIHICADLACVQDCIDGCEVLNVAKQFLGTFVHDMLGQHLQLELSDELDHQDPDISPSVRRNIRLSKTLAPLSPSLLPLAGFVASPSLAFATAAAASLASQPHSKSSSHRSRRY
jgi:hypothetical protein